MGWKRIIAHEAEDNDYISELFEGLFPSAASPDRALKKALELNLHVHDPLDENQIIQGPHGELQVSDNRENCYGCGEPNCAGHAGDADAFVISMHNKGEHEACHPLACSESPYETPDQREDLRQYLRTVKEERSINHHSGDHSGCLWNCPYGRAKLEGFKREVQYLHSQNIHDRCPEGSEACKNVEPLSKGIKPLIYKKKRWFDR